MLPRSATDRLQCRCRVQCRCPAVGIFPTETTLVRLAGAVLHDTHEEWPAAERRYVAEGSMAQFDPERDDAGAIAGGLRGAPNGGPVPGIAIWDPHHVTGLGCCRGRGG